MGPLERRREVAEPPGAEVLLEDESLGETPGSVELMAGTRQIVIRKPGYKTEQRTLTVVAGRAETLPLIELEPAQYVGLAAELARQV